MQLSDIIQRLRSTTLRTTFDAWVSANIEELTEFFYTLSKDDLLKLNFDTEFYFGEFTKSAIFKEFEKTKKHSEPFDAFLYLLASVAEKLAENYGLMGTIDHLLSYLPESSVKYRLKALTYSQNIDNIRKDYIAYFPYVLGLLLKAETLAVENQNQRLVNFLIYYFQKAEKILKERGYLPELEQLKSDFMSSENISRFRFLGHISIQELIAGRYPHQLEIENSELSILYPSTIIENHFKYNINLQVFNHNNSKGYDILMGYDKVTVLNNILNRGKTKFDEPYESLVPSDKVLLYCYFNMKKHFFTSVAVFKKMWGSLTQIFESKKYTPIFIDLGCGPLTSGLALAEIHKNEIKEPLLINYIGIDISDAMIQKAKEFSESELFHSDSTFIFYKNWNDIESEVLINLAGKNNPFFINASYLFTNLSAELTDNLAKFVVKLVNEFKNVHFIFQNPDRVDRNENWERFKGQIKFEEINKVKKVEHVVYKTSKTALRNPGEEDVFYEILTLKV